MVYIKQLELTNFKSFGSTTAIPLLPGFTVISGPNGSGKSNLLDALLFALGLAGSKGMRAERLPDLVNHSQTRRGQSIVETRVTVTFNLEGLELEASEADNQTDATTQPGVPPPELPHEWQITRKLRVTKQGTYTSTYYVNDHPCTLNELHAQLNQLRIYPEGYNVVLQGDVTGIISMNARQRREIIDELAGVGDFDRKINQAKEKLATVKEREDRFRIVETELIDQRDRLARDRQQAEKYQKLRAELQTKTQWEGVLVWRQSQQQLQHLQQNIQTGDRTQADLQQQLDTLNQTIQQGNSELERLNAQVKALGEEELLKLQATLASRSAELRQVQRQQQDLVSQREATLQQVQHSQAQMQEHLEALDRLAQDYQQKSSEELPVLQQQRDQAQQALEAVRQQSTTLASAASAWVQQQTSLRQQLETLLHTLDPQRSEQARLLERSQQLHRQIEEQTTTLAQLEAELQQKQTEFTEIQTELEQQQEQIQTLARETAIVDQELKLQQETQTRLQREQREKQRQLDKLEAQQLALLEAQGTFATRLILAAQLPGVYGMVAQLGRVDPQYQLALEIAAGARLGNIVVEDDAVAAAGIEILKRERGGRATFLPLNKIQPPRSLPDLLAEGAIDYAVHLVEFEPRFQSIFAYVFANTVVFNNINQARRYLGQYRMVTLEGDLLESTGAMTGGSRPSQQSLHFGRAETSEVREVSELKQRLQEIDHLLQRLEQKLTQLQQRFQQKAQALNESRQQEREIHLRLEQRGSEIKTLTSRVEKLRSQLQDQTTERTNTENRLEVLEIELPAQEAKLAEIRLQLVKLEQSQTHSEWQSIQQLIQSKEADLNQQELALRSLQQRLQDLENQQQRLQEKVQQIQTTLQTCRSQQTSQLNQQSTLDAQEKEIQTSITQVQAQLAQLEQTLGAEKQARDRLERQLREQLTSQQQLQWQLQKLQETLQQQREQLTILQTQIAEQAIELPDPLPEIPENLDLEQLRQELRSQQKRLQAMEPVNMLAIEEYERTQTRLEELSEKLNTLEEERTELLLRIENFTTLRHQAFREAFDAVNANFQIIFAELSDGDGYLQLENPEDPFQGGLNLVAHPKGKPVQRLASMSGGEKSLTALSFIFALQRYRPSPFYAFDEVDMFLDGANVEKLSRMIQKQAQQAQFIVVSLRRPMIEASERTIGVTQARGTHTQVIGLQLRESSH